MQPRSRDCLRRKRPVEIARKHRANKLVLQHACRVVNALRDLAIKRPHRVQQGHCVLTIRRIGRAELHRRLRLLDRLQLICKALAVACNLAGARREDESRCSMLDRERGGAQPEAAQAACDQMHARHVPAVLVLLARLPESTSDTHDGPDPADVARIIDHTHLVLLRIEQMSLHIGAARDREAASL